MRDKDELDVLLDSALSTYAEPRSGLEERVLNGLAEGRLAPPAKSRQTPFPVRRWIPLAVGLAVAACLLLVLMVHNSTRPREIEARNPASSQPQPHRTIAPPSNTAGEPTHLAFARTVKPRAQHSAPVQQAALPKLDVFPAPQPLTPQEQALVVFVAQAPETERKAVVEAQQQIETPISVAAIHIPPLESPDKGQP